MVYQDNENVIKTSTLKRDKTVVDEAENDETRRSNTSRNYQKSDEATKKKFTNSSFKISNRKNNTKRTQMISERKNFAYIPQKSKEEH